MSVDTAVYHLRTVFYQYESTFVLTHLDSYLQTVQRHRPECAPLLSPTMQMPHSLIQFESSPYTKINAYQVFPLTINMVHSFNPSEVYFSATLENHKTLFPGSFKLLHPLQQDNHAPTMIAMNTPTGTFRLPSHYPRHQKENITLHSVNLTICLESLQFAESPFIQWKPVETHNGSLHFPNTQSILAALPVVQHHPPPNHMFKNPQVKHLRWTQRQVLDPLLDRQFLPQTQQLTRRGF